MKEITPTLPVLDPSEKVLLIAKNQPQYRTLPAVLVDKNTSVTRWHFPFWHRIRLLFTGNLYIETMTFTKEEWREKQSQPVYPQYLYTEIRWLQRFSDWYKRKADELIETSGLDTESK